MTSDECLVPRHNSPIVNRHSSIVNCPVFILIFSSANIRLRMLAIAFSCLLTLVLFLPDKPQSAAAQKTRSLLVEGTRLLEANQAEAARIKFETALKLDPASAEAYYMLGVTHEQKRDLSSAVAAYRSALQYAPKMAEAHDRLGFALGQQGKIEEALREFRLAVAGKPGFFDA